MPLTLVSQYLPDAYEAVHQRVVSLNPNELVLFRIRQVLAKYAHACTSQGDSGTAP